MTKRFSIAATRGRDVSRFDCLFEDHYRRIYRFAYRLCGDRTRAEDLAMETFTAAWEARHRFEGRSAVATWLYRIAIHKWREMRCSPDERTVPADSEPAISPPDPGEIILTEAIEALEPSIRECFLLVRIEGLKYREAASVLGIPTGTVQTRVYQASQTLRRKLSGTYPLEVPADEM